jgi:hypothetical protein
MPDVVIHPDNTWESRRNDTCLVRVIDERRGRSSLVEVDYYPPHFHEPAHVRHWLARMKNEGRVTDITPTLDESDAPRPD